MMSRAICRESEATSTLEPGISRHVTGTSCSSSGDGEAQRAAAAMAIVMARRRERTERWTEWKDASWSDRATCTRVQSWQAQEAIR